MTQPAPNAEHSPHGTEHLLAINEPVPSSPLLRRLIATLGGSAPLSEVFTAGLYDPQDGYYTRHIRTIGRHGDFSTTPQLTNLLGDALACWIKQRKQHLRLPHGAGLIELGPGLGELFAQTWKSLGWWHRRTYRPALVELSPVLCVLQKSRLAHMRHRINWFQRSADALGISQGQALLWGHEFADAFPPTFYQRHQGQWHELWVVRRPNGELRLALSHQPTKLPHLGDDWPEGQRVEIPDQLVKYLRELLIVLNKGTLLLIDYGGCPHEIYHRRPRGTLRSYYHHQRDEGLAALANLGRRDLTCDVDFTYVCSQVSESELVEIKLCNLEQFLCEFLSTPPHMLDKHITTNFQVLEITKRETTS